MSIPASQAPAGGAGGASPPIPSPIDLCGVELRGPILNGSGTFDALAARRAFGDALLERFPFDCFVSKTITLEPRQGNAPPRLWDCLLYTSPSPRDRS